jgi:hypothetical protein
VFLLISSEAYEAASCVAIGVSLGAIKCAGVLPTRPALSVVNAKQACRPRTHPDLDDPATTAYQIIKMI